MTVEGFTATGKELSSHYKLEEEWDVSLEVASDSIAQPGDELSSCSEAAVVNLQIRQQYRPEREWSWKG